MSDVLCLYYSRSGKTKKAMLEVAEALDAELVEIHDAVERGGSFMLTFLKAHGQKLENVAYVVTRSSDGKNEEVYDQMDLYTAQPHAAAVSLRSGSVGYTFWQEEFLRQVRELLAR